MPVVDEKGSKTVMLTLFKYIEVFKSVCKLLSKSHFMNNVANTNKIN